jgi:hypothetical protein
MPQATFTALSSVTFPHVDEPLTRDAFSWPLTKKQRNDDVAYFSSEATSVMVET